MLGGFIMKNNGYLYAKIGSIGIIIFMFCSFLWSLNNYAMPTARGVISLVIGILSVGFLLRSSDLIVLLEEENKRN